MDNILFIGTPEEVESFMEAMQKDVASRPTFPKQELSLEDCDCDVCSGEEPSEHDAVHSPNHYSVLGGLEAIKIIRNTMTDDQWYGYCLGNIMKYRLRAGEKDALQQDIDKANKYKELYEELK